MKRRNFLELMAVVSGAALTAQCRQDAGIGEIRRDGNQLDIALVARQTRLRVAGRSRTLLAYNGQVPGPLLEMRAGDRVRLTLHNQLETATNLHHHGLHISPQVDDVFREVAPGDTYTYEYTIPSNHPAVTAWYHPHYHLNVAPQVFGGLAGGLIIRGELDAIPEVQAATEAVLILQDTPRQPQAVLQAPHPLGKRWGREGELLLANGQQNPVVPLPHQGLLRLRLMNAAASRIFQLQLPNHPWFLIATDRGAIAQPTELETLLLAPGERVELLIPGQREPGDYPILSLPYDRGIASLTRSLGEAAQQMPGVVPPFQAPIATLRYEPSDIPEPLPLPQQLIAVEPLPEPQTTREFVLNHGQDTTASVTGFTINGQSFVMDRVDTQVQLNQVEEWRIINQASMDHPFHLHTNRFQVIERNGTPEPLRAWKDTVNIAAYETVTLRVRFEDFVGRTVYHCHILDHEDQGMMGIIEMTDDRADG